MTRQQVAKRLGNSLATVRRLEGVRLTPVQDARGVHHFDPDEVEALARDIQSGNVTLWQELGPTSGTAAEDTERPCLSCIELEEQVRVLRDQLRDQRVRHERELASLEAKHEREAREVATQVAELLASFED
jgi:hypothetical protein